MSKKDINKAQFDEATLLKLDIFRRCFREWLPVFLHNPFITNIIIYDLFAGSGKDIVGNPGSPLILLEEARGDNYQHCTKLIDKPGFVSFAFNEGESEKLETLKSNVSNFIENCKINCPIQSCNFSGRIFYKSSPFKTLIESDNFQSILNNRRIAKFILLDQYGISQITENIFTKLINSPNTDFIFFISSSTIRRFKNHDNITAYFDTSKIKYDEALPKECHRQIADYYRSLIPCSKEYYLKHFTIQKGTNYYGLILGSGHSLGMEKFVKVCWQEDPLAGESNCNINNDYVQGSLFYNEYETNVKQMIKDEIKDLILSGKISDNITGLKYVLSKGCEPSLFVEFVELLIKQHLIEIPKPEKFNRQASRIHNVKPYHIVITK